MKNENIIEVFLETAVSTEKSEIGIFIDSLQSHQRRYIVEYMEGLQFDGILDSLTLDDLRECKDIADQETVDENDIMNMPINE